MGVQSDGERLVDHKSVVLEEEDDMRGGFEHVGDIAEGVNGGLVVEYKHFAGWVVKSENKA